VRQAHCKPFFTKIRRYMLARTGGRFALAAKIDALLKLGVIASLLIASSGVGYYYAVYLPARDALRETERQLEKFRAYGQMRAEQQRLDLQQRQLLEQKAAAKAAADGRYQTCLSSASADHDAAWATQCKSIADKAVTDHADCLAKPKLSKAYCDAAYRTRDDSANCTLPLKNAADLDGGLNSARNRCLQERNAALR